MHITLTAYSILRESLPDAPGGKLEVELPGGATIADLLVEVGLPKETACAVNDSIQRDPTTRLRDGDRVSVFRPGSGGQSSQR